MPIAPRVKSLTHQLDEARQQHRLGRLELASLQKLDHQVTALLEDVRNTHFETGVLCLHAVVRSLETLALQSARKRERLVSQSALHTGLQPGLQSEPQYSQSMAVA